MKGDFGEVEIVAPRDRLGEFEPQILPKHERCFTGFDNKVLSMYARRSTTNRKPPTGEIPPLRGTASHPHHHKSKKTRMPPHTQLSQCK